MRGEFFKLLRQEMARDPSIYLLIADMGLGLVEPIQNDFPDRYLNVGISEQNMIGIAAGLCNAGFHPFCYTISNFLTERCFEQVRNDVCLHKYPITLVGTSTGFDNGLLGPTHQVIDDIGCMKILPNMNVYSPTSLTAARMVFAEVLAQKLPAYVRIGKSSFDLKLPVAGLNHMVRENPGADVLAVTHGTMLENCLSAADFCPRLSVYAMNRIKPVDTDEFRRLCGRFSRIVVIEDHMATSGLYNSLCQCMVETAISGTSLRVLATPELYEDVVGTRDYFADRYGYSPKKIAGFVAAL